MSHRTQSARTKIRRLATGRLISVTGGAAAYTALNFTIWHRTHSPGMQALSLLLTFGVAGFLSPFAGALGDRFDRRTVMVWSEAIAAAFFLAMAFARSPAWLIGLAFGSAIAELPFFSASRAAIPNLVESEDQISWANSLVTVGVHSGIAVGPLIGGVLGGTVGASWVFALNAVSFLISLVLTLSVHGSFQESREAASAEDEPKGHGGIAAGLAFLWHDRTLRRMSVAWFVFVLGMGMSMVADAPLAEHFGVGAVGFALLITCWGTGSVLGAATGRWMHERTEPVWLVAGSFGIALAAFGVGFAPLFPLVLISLLIMGTSDGFTMVAENGIMQRRTPDAVRSRTMAAFESVLSFGLAIAYLIAGPVLRAFQSNPQVVYVIGGVFASAAACTLVPLLRLRHASHDVAPETERMTEAEPKLAVEPQLFASAEGLEIEPVAAVREDGPGA
ncbi:MAG TPA: MFS transporter [Actinomycetota bacterium]|nr:MFS transporter [Actinomycetota bacterium]